MQSSNNLLNSKTLITFILVFFWWQTTLKKTHQAVLNLSNGKSSSSNLSEEWAQVLKKFPAGFLNFFQDFKSTHFWVYFQFKVKFKIKNVLSSVITLKRYHKATSNRF